MRRFLVNIITIIQGAGLALATLLYIASTSLIISVAKEGRQSFFWRYESEPPEGWEFWRQKLLQETLPGDIIFAVIVTGLFLLLVWGWYRFWKKIKN